MYYQNYEDYMRSVLGYPMENQNTYRMETIGEQFNNNIMYRNTKELEECYPEIYKMINPIVCEVCDRNTNVTRNDIENMVEEVYQKVIVNNEITVRLNIDNRSVDKEENRNNNVKTNNSRIISNEPIRQTREVENRQRRPNNNQFLRDLIRILILNRLLGGGQGRPPRPRPPFPGQERPPFPGGPGGMMPRPPQPRNYEDYYKF